MRLTREQIDTMRRELTVALDQLAALDHLCSIQELAGRVEEAIGGALYVLECAEVRAGDPPRDDSA